MNTFTDQERRDLIRVSERHNTLHALFSTAEIERMKFIRWLIGQQVLNDDLKEPDNESPTEPQETGVSLRM
jgi:hypothetical protein